MPPVAELAFPDLPRNVARILSTLADAGHEAVLVGGCVRDALFGVEHRLDWDAATSATPEQVAALFPDATWENRFGTVTVRGEPPVEVTAYRAEGGYADRRRPDDVQFGVDLESDLSRRDFTINAIAWLPTDLEHGTGRLVDPFDGQADLARRLLRTVGEPRERFTEDALRLVRAARFAGRFGMTLDPATEAVARELAPTAASVSAERVRDELLRMLRFDPMPSRAIGWLERLGLLEVLLPELAALRGIPQSKPIAGDALDHTLRAVDAMPKTAPVTYRLAALVHDLGKATTLRDGHFIGHEEVGADLAREMLRRLRLPHTEVDQISAAVGHHMFDYDDAWTDAAVRRFIRRTDEVDRELLFALRRADNRASGVSAAGDANLAALEARIAAEVKGQPELLMHRRLQIDGHDLQRELGIPPGPKIGAILDRLTELVLEDPSRNERATLLELARQR